MSIPAIYDWKNSGPSQWRNEVQMSHLISGKGGGSETTRRESYLPIHTDHLFRTTRKVRQQSWIFGISRLFIDHCYYCKKMGFANQQPNFYTLYIVPKVTNLGSAISYDQLLYDSLPSPSPASVSEDGPWNVDTAQILQDGDQMLDKLILRLLVTSGTGSV